MNNRRKLIVALGAGALAAPFGSFAQQQGKVSRIGFLASIAFPAQILEAFREGLRERGYVEGKNITVEYRWPAKAYEGLPDLAAELVKLKVDLIVTWSTPAAIAAKEATTTIPIVFVGVSDPVQSGLVVSLARPGGNVTGTSNLARDLSAKLAQLLLEVVPAIKRVAVLRNASTSTSLLQLEETTGAARILGIQFDVVDVRRPQDLAAAFAAMTKARAMGAVVLPAPMFLSEGEHIAQLALKRRIPTVFARGENVEAGGLISYGPSLPGQIRQTAGYVDRILKGIKPAELPVELPSTFELVVNMKTAKVLGIKIPNSILVRADKLIE